MKKHAYKTDWLEVSSGVIFTVLALSIHFSPDLTVQAPINIATLVLLFGIGMSFVSHIFLKLRVLYYITLLQISVVFGFVIYWGVIHRSIGLTLFVVVFAVSVIWSQIRREIIFHETQNEDIWTSEGRNGMVLVAGSFLAILGASLSVSGFFPVWYRFLNVLGSYNTVLFLSIGILLAVVGGALLASELNDWKGIRKKLVVWAGFVVFGLLAYGAYSIELTETGGVLALFGVLYLMSDQWNFMYVYPPGILHAKPEERLIFGYEYAGKLGLWMTIAFAGIYFMYVPGLYQNLFFFGIAITTVIGVVSYHIIPIRYYNYNKYFFTLIGVIAPFSLIVSSSGGLGSPFVPFGAIIVFAGTVLSVKLVPIPAVIIFLLFFLDFFGEFMTFGYSSFERTINFAFVSLALITTALFTIVISRRREKNEDEMVQVSLELQSTLKLSEENKRISERQTDRFRRANEELIEMRAALMNVLEDVEETKRAIEVDHLRGRAIFQALGEGVVATDKDGKVILFNRVASDITGLSTEEAMGIRIERVTQFYKKDNDILSTEFFSEAFKGHGARLQDDLVVHHSRGRHIPIAGTVQPVFDDESNLAGIVVAFRDITIEKEIEEQKSGFISVASHQLRTPLSAMRWYVDLLLGGDAGRLTKQQREFLTDVHASIKRLATLVDALLNVSRAESGRLTFSPQETDMKSLIEQLIKEISGALQKKKQKLETELSDDVPPAYVDQKLIAQVFDNLISNAVKYTPEGGKVGVRLSKKDDKNVLLEVWDTGYGIPKDQQHNIFQKFFRGKRAVTMETVGTGLGLYIAKTVVDESGGKIWFESEEGNGTRFFVTLPVFKGKGTL